MWIEHWWNDPDREKSKYLERNLSQCHFAHRGGFLSEYFGFPVLVNLF
jgi:hypothetical protein